MSPILAVLLILLEFIIGMGLLLSVRSKKLAVTTTILMSFMTFVTLIVYISGYVKDCGCFGDVWHLSNGETFLKNIILLPFVVFIQINCKKLNPVWNKSIMMTVNKLLSAIGLLVFLGVNYFKLPLIDFRGYKIGTNLRYEIETQDKKMSDYLLSHTKYVYRNGNVTREFSPDSLPSDDCWDFVEIKQPKEIVGVNYDFHPIDIDSEEDISDKILSDKKPLIIVVTKSLDNIDSKSDIIITSIANKMYELGYSQYIVYNGEHSESNNFADLYANRLGSVANLDKTTINTIVRTTPAILVMRDGIIIDKISKLDFPNLNNITKFVEHLDTIKSVKKDIDFRIYVLVISIILAFIGNIKHFVNLVLIKNNNLDNEKKHCSRELENEQNPK